MGLGWGAATHSAARWGISSARGGTGPQQGGSGCTWRGWGVNFSVLVSREEVTGCDGGRGCGLRRGSRASLAFCLSSPCLHFASSSPLLCPPPLPSLLSCPPNPALRIPQAFGSQAGSWSTGVQGQHFMALERHRAFLCLSFISDVGIIPHLMAPS